MSQKKLELIPLHCDGPQEIGGILETSFYLNCEIYSYCKNVCIKINKKKF